MAIGPTVRRLFGKYEPQIAALYRSIYIDLDDYIGQIERWVKNPKRILEIGAGEGAVTERLAEAFPNASITGIDITDNVGRLYAGPTGKVTFEQKTVQEVAASQPGSYDFVILSDVLHHVPTNLRPEILSSARQCLSKDGLMIFKDWGRARTPIHMMCLASDRYLTGDDVSFLTATEAEQLLAHHFGASAIADRTTIAPWSNNYAFLING